MGVKVLLEVVFTFCVINDNGIFVIKLGFSSNKTRQGGGVILTMKSTASRESLASKESSAFLGADGYRFR